MKIIVIEDNLLTAKIIKTKLENISSVITVDLFEKVSIALAQSSSPQIIILDHYLPGVNGVETIPVIKEKYPDCKIIVFSGQHDVKIMADAYENGADLYISKDNESINELMAAVEEIVNEKSPSILDTVFLKLKESFSGYDQTKGKKKIYIVEDDDLFAFLLTKKISDEHNVNIEHFTNAKDCINNLHHNPDVIILDYHLKGVSTATDILDQIDKEDNKARLFVLSNQKEISVANRLMARGIDQYFVKDKDSISKIVRAI